jgi:tetratricopeptide (TPR) repeat protein
MGDRYTYIPSLGVLILAVWGAYELTRRWRHHVMVLSVAGSVAIVLCMALTQQQLGHWRDSEALFRHALEVTENNYLAHFNLGIALGEKDRPDEAILQFQKAIRLNPDYATLHYNLGNFLYKKGRTDEAIEQYQEAVELQPDLAQAHYNLGIALYAKGQSDAAIHQFQTVIRLRPDHAEARNNLGKILALKNKSNVRTADPAKP